MRALAFLLAFLPLIASAQIGGFPSQPKFRSAQVTTGLARGGLILQRDITGGNHAWNLTADATGNILQWLACTDQFTAVATDCSAFLTFTRSTNSITSAALTTTTFNVVGALQQNGNSVATYADGAPTFSNAVTSPQFISSYIDPQFLFTQTTGAANEKNSRVHHSGGIHWTFLNDALSAETEFFGVTRVGTTPTTMTLTATTINAVGALQKSGNPVAVYADTTANFTGNLQHAGNAVAAYADITANFTGNLQHAGNAVAAYADTTANFTGNLQHAGNAVAAYADTTANFTGTLQRGGVDVAVQTSGSFTGFIGGCTTDPAPTITWQKIGNVAFIHIPRISCTSNAGSFTVTNLPLALRPTVATHSSLYACSDNSAATRCYVQVNSSSAMAIFLESGNWTISGTKEIPRSSPGSIDFSYIVL